MARAPSLRRRPIWIGGWLLFLLPLPLALKAVISLWRGDFGGLFGGALAFAMLMLGAVLMRKGLAQAKGRPTGSGFPWKTGGSIVVALGTALTALLAGHNVLIAGGFGLGALAGCYLAYGFDQRLRLSADKDVNSALEEAYQKLAQLEAAGRRITSREFKERLGLIIGWGEKILERISEDPEDFRRARKFLNVYLDGARQVTEKYARTHGEAESAELEENFRKLLTDMEAVCEEQYQRLLDDDMVDLDVQIEVLTTRLKREGVV
jgi:5-bromo-4-chloroindolyl phosphate hydrolysis protein